MFSFIKYLSPGWQFNLLPHSNHFAACYTRNYEAAAIDKRYFSAGAQVMDAGFLLWNKGALLHATQADAVYINSLAKPTLTDEYIFIRKYGGIVWTTYALVLRILAFHNPFKEIKNYFATRKIQKVDLFKEPVAHQNYATFSSKLLADAPLVAVIIPTLNRYAYLKDVLRDLEAQTYKNIEVIIVDQSDLFDKTFYENFTLNIRLYHQREKKLWTARNKAISVTGANYLLFFDDDSRVEPDWIAEHLKCLDYFDADISAGVSKSVTGGKIPRNYNYFRWADQFDSGNAMVKRKVFEKTGLFDEQFNGMRMGDGEFGIRAYLHGFVSISNSKAARVHLKAEQGGLRDMSGWDGFRANNMFAPKPVPSVTFLYHKYFPPALARHAILKGMLLSNVSYKHKSSTTMMGVSMLLSIVKAPVLYIQYKASKKKAKAMLQQNGIQPLMQKNVQTL